MRAPNVKILSDFDGVWTDQAEEAAAIRACFDMRLAELAGRPVADELAALLAHVRAHPSEYGWAPEGRITAYVDEDPLLESSALALAIDRAAAHSSAHALRAAIERGGHASATAFANACFLAAMAEFRERHAAEVVPGSLASLRELAALGAEVVVVSNSPPDKLQHWFARAGVPLEGPAALLRLRGNARKWHTASDAAEPLGGRALYVDRPHYRAVLEEERADLVIGDVYSLDLALPAKLRREGASGAPRTLVLRRHPHSPRWVVEGRAGGAIDRMVASVTELPGLVRELQAAGARA
jgi:FMN phosphatase YigB (HAD superfamily)